MKSKFIYLFLCIFIGFIIICSAWMTNDPSNGFFVQIIGFLFFVIAIVFAAKMIIDPNK